MDGQIAALRAGLEQGELGAGEALTRVEPLARDAPARATRHDACRLIGDLAGRAFGAEWSLAERAAWSLLGIARIVETPADRAGLLVAMGHAFRNAWLLPYVHSRIDDRNPTIARAAIIAAGGLGFPALEEAIASRWLDPQADAAMRHAAIAALGHMGAASAAERVASFIDSDDRDASVALTALTEIRSDAGAARAIARLAGTPSREVTLAGIRYLAEIGRPEVLPRLRRLARDADPEMRLAGSLASRAFKAECDRDAAERILVALTERDRAVRGSLARRLRTLPVLDVIREAEVLFADDPEGVLQVLAEIRAPEVTRFFLGVASRHELAVSVRARAIGDVEPNEAWEREALARVALDPGDEAVRIAAARALGAFATTGEVLRVLGPLAKASEPPLRAAFLWALQLAARPRDLAPAERSACESAVRGALHDDDPDVRRRAAFVAGNLQLKPLGDELVRLAQTEPERVEIRVAAFVALADLATTSRVDDLAALFRKDSEPEALAAASRALCAIAVADPGARANVDKVAPRLPSLLHADDARSRGAAVRLAGVLPGAVPIASLTALARDPSTQVREQVLLALGRLSHPDALATLIAALEDADPAVHEQAAEALLGSHAPAALERLIEFCAGEDDAAARARIAERFEIPASESESILPALDRALHRLREHDPAYEPLLEQKIQALERVRPSLPSNATATVDDAIVAAFPTFVKLSRVRAFEPLRRSLRTAEALYRTAPSLGESDLTPPIVLWMKCLEGYVHAWLSPRLVALQQDSRALFDVVDRMLGSAWGEYQRYLASRWNDSVTVGAMSVEIPLRALSNALREFHDRRGKRLESPLSITEWARLMIFLAIDHPSGARNLLRVTAKDGEALIRLAHRLHALAAVRNAVTHRTVADSATLEAFRSGYYVSFEELTRMA